MAVRRIVAPALDFAPVRSEFDLPADFPAAALAEARATSDRNSAERADRTDIPFVTIDPPGSMDLDQAMHLERRDDGFVVRYAIADVASVVVPGGALDVETHRRGQTLYLPDGSVPLHPRELSEGSASLLPEQVRPAVLWTIDLDAAGQVTNFAVERALVRSVQRFDYAEVQAAAEASTLHPSIAALPEVGRLRQRLAIERGAIELGLPEQDVVPDGSARWRLVLSPRTPADAWNAQISLLTGMCAAQLMIRARIGLLRTLPSPDPQAIDELRKTAQALGVTWPATMSVGEMLAGLDPTATTTLALMSQATTLLRGADYVAFDHSVPDHVEHAGIAAPYAHVTAPLRRLADRYATEVCLAVDADKAVPDWVRSGLAGLPETMRGSDALAAKVERACIDRTEAYVLADRVGESFSATGVRPANGKRDAEIFVAAPPVFAKCSGHPPEGTKIIVKLTRADTATRTVEFDYSGH
ncbi:RNB domain-containing ribonuclease [Skermania sp. ID1734]|uniref:RNB domain-containing ribonuclease n=1 Tax=Skermania sp. ID1734 TaxID=2597516 RepID=UPI00117C18FD|nr:RNB domain-containing ribonuclease [Skermania sp. ID1734]TSE01089.1 RNB domain-containing ribonuclease [Skermania sp. ID1734]